MGDKQSVQVTIFRQTYMLRTSGDEKDVQELADTVDQVMTAIAARSQSADSSRIAVLACLHIADQLRTLERELADLRQRVNKKTEQFRLLLDQAIDNNEHR